MSGEERTQVRIDENGRPEPPYAADERSTLIGFLEWQRSTLEWKTRGLDETGLRATTAKSTMTLAGILKHMAWVEDHWFSYILLGRERAEPWTTVDFSFSPDWEWTSALADSAEAVRSMWVASCAASRSCVDEAMSHSGLDQLSTRSTSSGDQPSLRWILVHMIEEYARHNGHADLLREAVDGQVGE
ncbi:MAG: mini-circle protein [Acidimicrobiales bacterium mtb01]|nr:DinB family protein [Actinomycetota bacterium]TEX47388.1 MAG: mini-circle protein [Acidimicrobiales bacterium mtb01]